MHWKGTGLMYSRITIVIHLVVVALVAATVWLGITAICFSAPGQSDMLVKYHDALGVVIFVISCYRLWHRITASHPLVIGSPSPVGGIIGRSVAFCLVLATVLLRVAGRLSMSASGMPIELAGGITLPSFLRSFVPTSDGIRHVMKLLHKIGALPSLQI